MNYKLRQSKVEKNNFYALTWLIFAGLITYVKNQQIVTRTEIQIKHMHCTEASTT